MARRKQLICFLRAFFCYNLYRSDPKKQLLIKLGGEKYMGRSLKWKMILFLTVQLMLFGLSNGYSIIQSQRYIGKFNDVLGKYYTINFFLEEYKKGADMMDDYILEPSQETLEQYRKNEEEVKASLEQLSQLSADMGEDSYLLIRAIRNIYRSYEEKANLYHSARVHERAAIAGQLRDISGYMDSYNKELLKTSLSYGAAVYGQLCDISKWETGVSLVTFIISLIFSCVFAVYVLWRVVSPVLALSRASNEIEKENFDIPDIQVFTKDEISILAHSFDQMKHGLKRTLSQLRQQHQLEKQLYEEQVKNIKMEKMMENAKYSLLQSQVNPHFLLNTLNMIASTAKQEEAKATEESIIQLSRMFRYTLETKNRTVSLTRELLLVQDYLRIQKKRFGDRLRFQFRVRLDGDMYQIPAFMLQPLVENSIKHGLMKRTEGGMIRVCAEETEDEIVLTVLDNGTGMDKKTAENLLRKEEKEEEKQEERKQGGIGLNNVYRRLLMIYPGSTFKIRSKEGMGTSITIKIKREVCEDV